MSLGLTRLSIYRLPPVFSLRPCLVKKRITLQDLPLEHFLDIVALLPTADKRCLRIACSDFRKIILFNWGAPLNQIHLSEFYFLPKQPQMREIAQQRFSFIRRCFRPRNIFWKLPRVEGCGNCMRVMDAGKFSIKTLQINDRSACDGCLVGYLKANLPMGCGIGYGGEATYSCRECGTRGRREKMHFNHEHADGRPKPRLCVACHKWMCKKPGCKGWPTGFVEENERHFR